MERMGAEVVRDGYERFRVKGGQIYRCGTYTVEADCSQAGYFWASAAITGAEIKVMGTTVGSRQGDARFPFVLEAMGCRIFPEKDGIKVIGGPLSSVEVDMSDMPDLVPTLAVVAAFAEGTTVIKNVGHLKGKESDRLTCVAKELSRMGIRAYAGPASLTVTGGTPSGAAVETYGDHRMAMSFAVAGLRVPGVFISNEECVEKSFPNFWAVFDGLFVK
jgi:3-phosphoshikimate 1-carboxyvinyltransferase